MLLCDCRKIHGAFEQLCEMTQPMWESQRYTGNSSSGSRWSLISVAVSSLRFLFVNTGQHLELKKSNPIVSISFNSSSGCRRSGKQINTYERGFKIHPSTARSKTAASAIRAAAKPTLTPMCFGAGVTFERKRNMTVNLPNTFPVSTKLHEEEPVSPFTIPVWISV